MNRNERTAVECECVRSFVFVFGQILWDLSADDDETIFGFAGFVHLLFVSVFD